MAVVAVWKCDRDGSMFDDKKLADAHDKMLELAANITQLIENSIKSVKEDDAEAIGLLLAKRSEDLAKACKGKPELLLATAEKPDDAKEAKADNSDGKVTALAG